MSTQATLEQIKAAGIEISVDADGNITIEWMKCKIYKGGYTVGEGEEKENRDVLVVDASADADIEVIGESELYVNGCKDVTVTVDKPVTVTVQEEGRDLNLQYWPAGYPTEEIVAGIGLGTETFELPTIFAHAARLQITGRATVDDRTTP